MSDYYYIPNELMRKILTYLPAKSLVRFTCVCKSWKSLITSSDFITTHLIQNTLSSNSSSSDVDGNNLVLLRYCGPGHPKKMKYSLHIDNESFDHYEVSELSKPDWFLRVLGSCNGLICLSDNCPIDTNTIVLWNPSIRKYLTLPLPNFTYHTHGPFDHAIGFGFDSRTNDYKVVRLVYLLAEGIYCSPRVELYKLSTGSWETITTTTDHSCNIFYHNSRQAFLNGAVHWPAIKTDTGGLIMSFNMSDEVFHEIGLPADIDSHILMRMPLAVYGEWLSFYDYHTSFDYIRCSIWVMKEYGVVKSWAKLYTLDLDGGFGKMLGFRRNGEILLVMRNKELVSCDPENRQVKHLGIYDTHEDSCRYDQHGYSFHVEAYVESLTLLGDANKPGQSL